MKILLISSYIFGYMEVAVTEMKRQGHEVTVLYYEDAPLRYTHPGLLQRSVNGMKKLVGRNAKHHARGKVLKKLLAREKFDYTLVVHGQYLNAETHRFLKSITKVYAAYFFDSLHKMPAQKKIAGYFDIIFSYEPDDCENEGYEFITNFVPSENFRSTDYKTAVFNISAHDHRLPVLKRIADYFSQNDIKFKFMLYSTKVNQLNGFEVMPEKTDMQLIGEFITETKCLLDIQRMDQKGLSFRPFEAMGNYKKLITNNPEIMKYDFYNPANILIINDETVQIPLSFLNTDYQKIDDHIYQKYTVETWTQRILSYG